MVQANKAQAGIRKAPERQRTKMKLEGERSPTECRRIREVKSQGEDRSTTDQGGARGTRKPGRAGGLTGHGGEEGFRSHGGATGSTGQGRVSRTQRLEAGTRYRLATTPMETGRPAARAHH